MRLTAALFASLLFASVCSAAPKKAVQIEPADFAASRDTIEDVIRSTDRYSELTLSQREEMNEALDRMEAVLAAVDSIEELDKRSKTQLFNDQELINNLLTKAFDDSRLICKREKRVGSHRYTNVCITVGERRRQKDALTRDAMYLQRGDSLLSD